MSIKIRDIASHLGLSPATVSKALNNRSDVSPETRARVLQAVRELDYHPNASARNLRRKRTSKLGFILPFPFSYISEYVAELLTGAVLAAEQHGYHLTLYTNSSDPISQLMRICRAREVDGLLLRATEPIDETVALLNAEQMPFVVLGRRINRPDVSYIAPDNIGGSLLLMRHLISLGHRRIGFTARPQLFDSNTDRLAGYRQALDEAGIPYDPQLVVNTTVEPRSGYTAMNQLLDLPNPPTALFAIHDLIAFDALQAIAERGLRVPQDIAVASFDGIQSTAITTPPLTTVRQPLPEMGQRAVEMLLERIADSARPPQQVIVPVHLIVRGSTVAA